MLKQQIYMVRLIKICTNYFLRKIFLLKIIVESPVEKNFTITIISIVSTLKIKNSNSIYETELKIAISTLCFLKLETLSQYFVNNTNKAAQIDEPVNVMALK